MSSIESYPFLNHELIPKRKDAAAIMLALIIPQPSGNEYRANVCGTVITIILIPQHGHCQAESS